jgi:hypothetical protein
MQITFHNGGDSWDVSKASTDKDFQHLVSLQDIHCGHPAFRKKDFEKLVKFVYENDALWFYNGDGPENANKSSVGDSINQAMNPNNQLKYLYDNFSIIKHNCIGWNSGNHDDRTKKTSDFDFSLELADRLGIPGADDYESFGIVSKRDERDGGTAYTWYACHSGSGHKNAGLSLNNMESNWSWQEGIDIKAKGHDHQVGVLPVGVSRMDVSNKCVRERTVWLWLPGSFLRRPKTYAGKKPYKPTPPIYYSLLLDMRKGHKRVDQVTHYLD